ncbi:MAG: hypothetical protein H0Z39_02795 [Peptococcaceae bacterium]|nr:hypothetical protein [Peptococcaceae bacterium]
MTVRWDVRPAYEIEQKIFAVNNYYGVEGTTSYEILSGRIPLLVSAPHAVKHRRAANTEPKEQDEYTGTIARLLNEITGCYAMHATCPDLDPNFYDDCAYKGGVRRIVEENDIKLVLDIHGATRWRAFNVDIGSCHGKSVQHNPELLDLLLEEFRNHGIANVVVDDTFPGCGQPTVTRYVSAILNRAALQLEINKKLRDPEKDPESFVVLVECLASYIRKVAGLIK